MQTKQAARDLGDVDTQVDEQPLVLTLAGLAAVQDVAEGFAARMEKGIGRARAEQRLTQKPRPAALGDFPQLEDVQDAAALAAADLAVGPNDLDERQNMQHTHGLTIKAKSDQALGEVALVVVIDIRQVGDAVVAGGR